MKTSEFEYLNSRNVSQQVAIANTIVVCLATGTEATSQESGL
jgi:hypothetical protein